MKTRTIIRVVAGLAGGMFVAHQIIDYAGVEMLAVVCANDVVFAAIVGGAELVHKIRRGRTNATI